MSLGVELWAGVGGLVMGGIVVLWKSGIPQEAISKRRTASTAHEAIPEVVDKLDEVGEEVHNVREKLDEVDGKTDRNAYLIRSLHEGESVEVSIDDMDDVPLD